MANINLSMADNNNSMIQIRLNPDDLLNRIYENLSGKKYSRIPDANGNYKMELIENGKPLMNDQGIRMFQSIIVDMINPHTVQGNFKEQRYENFLVWFHTEIAYHLILNSTEWGIADNDIEYLITSVMALVVPFISRTIDNKEREGYIPTIRSEEKNIIHQNPDQAKGGISL